MGEKIFNKIIATSLIITLTFANVLLLGNYASESYAGSEIETNDSNVEFDSYFKVSNKNTYEVTSDINNTENIFFYINTKEGYIENPKIEIKNTIDGSGANIDLVKTNVESVKNINKNVIELNQINKNDGKEVEIEFKANKKETYNLKNLDADFKVIFTGTLVKENGKEKQIEKEVKRRVNWTAQVTPVLNHYISKYIPYELNGEKMLLIEEYINSSVESNILPTKSTNIQIEVPNINGKQPVDVKIRANSTKATNGKETEMTYNYEKEKNTIDIIAENSADENDNVSWKKNSTDQFVVTYIYNEDIFDGVDDDIKIKLKEQSKVEVYQKNTQIYEQKIEDEIELKDIIGSIVDTNITSTKSATKGYIYLNKDNETEYKTLVSTDISYSNIVSGISIYSEPDKFILKNDEVDNNEENTYYKSTKISKENFERILGIDGFIQIYNNKNELISTIDKNTLADEKNDFVVNYIDKSTNAIKVVTSKPQSEGRLKIINTKEIKSNLPYDKENLKNVKGLIIRAGVENGNSSETVLNFEETLTKADITINKNNLTTVRNNENVEFRVTLNNNKTGYDLYKNPRILIELPKEIEEINIKDVSLSNAEWLNIENYDLYKNENENLILQINTIGEQSNYDLQNNSNIVINTDIVLNKYAPSKDEVIKMNYVNENVNMYENNGQIGYSEIGVKIEAPAGVLTIDNIGVNNENITALLGETQAGVVETNSEAQSGKITGTVVNNTGADINNVNILGRIPFKDNKNMKTGESLGSNFDTTIKTAISVSKVNSENVVIYYSDNGEATNDIENANNNWKTEITDFTNIKSYLIVLKDYTFLKSDTITFNYEVNIPANLEKNQTSYAMYVVNYTMNNAQSQIISTPIGIATNKGPDVKLELTATRAGEELKDNAQVYAGEIIKYKVKATNNGTEKATNVQIKSPIPTGTTYVYKSPNAIISSEDYLENSEIKEQSSTIEEILPGESKEYEYEVRVNTISNENETVTIKNKATASGELGSDGEITSNELNILAKYGEVSVTMKAYSEVYDYKVTGELVLYNIRVNNITNQKLENIKVEINIPDELEYYKCGISDGEEYSSLGKLEGNKAVYVIEKLENEEQIVITLAAKIKSSEDISEKKAGLYATAQIKNNIYKSNKIETLVKQVSVTIKQTASVTSEYIKPQDELQYKFVIENKSSIDINDLVFTDNIPADLQVIDAKCGSELIETSGNGIIKSIELKQNESIEIVITVKVREKNDISNTTLENQASITSNAMGKTIQSNKIIHTIQIEDDPSDYDPSGNKVYKISGIAWEDENENGMRDPEERVIPDVLVGLINAETLEFVENKNSDIQISETDENGKYVFTGLPKGKYIVIVGLDESMYRLTVNNKKGVDENLNSDIYLREYTSDGQAFKIPSSGDLIVENSNISNIDIGLIKQAKFDLKLDKFVNRIIVQNKKGTKTYNYGDATLAKIELDRKHINNTIVIIEYKIRVTNEGEIDGYVTNIADYLPEDVKFNAELNSDWYVENQVAYNTSLANNKIAPGESIEVTLVVTKATTDSNTGIINNRAEIYDAYNELDIVDIDSRPGNNVITEDDYSKADVILGIKTGRPILYIGLTIALLTISAVSIYLIKKKS